MEEEEKKNKPFWNTQCLKISKNLWFPTKIDSAKLVSSNNSMSLSSSEMVERSLFWITKTTNQENKNSLKTYCPSLPYSTTVGTWGEDDTIIRTLKIKLRVNQEQRTILRKWMGTARKVYNKALNHIENENGGKMKSVYSLRDQFVTRKTRDGIINENIEEWQYETPKDIRAGAIRDLHKNFTNNFKKLEKCGITRFKMRFKCKREMHQSIEIPKTAISVIGNKIYVYKTILKTPFTIGKRTKKKWFGEDNKLLNEWNKETDVRLVCDKYNFFLSFPIKKRKEKTKLRHGGEMIALDPGLRTFQMGFSEKECIEFKRRDPKLIFGLRAKIDKLKSLRDKRKIGRYSANRKMYEKYERLKNVVDDLHWKTIDYLTTNYDTILLPIFKSQEMKQNGENKRRNRDFDTYKHYRFKMRLLEKSEEKGMKTLIVEEHSLYIQDLWIVRKHQG